MGVVKWFHHLFNPHCELCEEERLQHVECQSCVNLKEQLYYMQNLVANLQHLLTKAVSTPEAIVGGMSEDIKPIQTRHMPFRVKREQLEAERRQAATILRNRQEEIQKAGLNVKIPTHPAPATTDDSTDDLEKELGIVEAEREAESGKG